MCGLVGFVNLKHNISDKKDIITDMTKALFGLPKIINNI